MPAAPYLPSSYGHQPPVRRRAASFLLADLQARGLLDGGHYPCSPSGSGSAPVYPHTPITRSTIRLS